MELDLENVLETVRSLHPIQCHGILSSRALERTKSSDVSSSRSNSFGLLPMGLAIDVHKGRNGLTAVA
ncbi:Protein of unknown function [Gryllus bimaculatus]|nr:Protein of unknown function [Gryllus bimaculatus]